MKEGEHQADCVNYGVLEDQIAERLEEQSYLVLMPVYTWVKANNLAEARHKAGIITNGLSRLPELDAGATSITVWDEQGEQLFPKP